MQIKHLKTIRIAISLVIFIFLLLYFLNIHTAWSDAITIPLLRLQLFPSFIRFFAIAISVASLGFVLIILLTFLFGRVYCSSICPLGTLQDIMIRAGRFFRTKKKKRFLYSPSKHRILRYTILAATLAFWIFGSLFMVNLLDPFSNFGKISVTLFQPVFSLINNGLSFLLQRVDIYTITPILPQSLPINVVAVSSGIFITLAIMTGFRGRFFCNTICPAGSVLSLVSSKSVYKLKFQDESCTLCRKCEFACKAECIDSVNKSIDFSRCVSCFNCVEACNHSAIKYENTYIGQKEKETVINPAPINTTKRSFLLTMAAATLSIPLLKKMAVAQPATQPGMIPAESKLPVTPPGSISVDHFTSNCIACYLCVGACPTNVIVPSFFEYGLQGFMQPRLDYQKSFCNFDCTRCSEVCPTGAISLIDEETKHVTQTGIAKFMHDSCIVVVDGTDCGACSEHCPTKAVQMVPFGNLRIPEVNDELCIGCGACEFACPTKPYKAIFVEANEIHALAVPLEEDEGPKETKEEDFPF